MEMVKKTDQTPLDSAQWAEKGQWAPIEIGEIPFKHLKKFLHYDGDHNLEKVAHRDCGVSVSGDIQTPIGHSPQQPFLAVPALRNLSKGLSKTQLYCDIYI